MRITNMIEIWNCTSSWTAKWRPKFGSRRPPIFWRSFEGNRNNFNLNLKIKMLLLSQISSCWKTFCLKWSKIHLVPDDQMQLLTISVTLKVNLFTKFWIQFVLSLNETNILSSKPELSECFLLVKNSSMTGLINSCTELVRQFLQPGADVVRNFRVASLCWN